MLEANGQYYQPSGYNTTFDFKGQSFEEYIDFNRRKIRLARLDLNTDYPEIIIEANSPFAWLPKENLTEKKRGVLLVHGLFDSPFSLRDLGHVFYQQHFLVYSLLLPGHGTVPGDLTQIQYPAWQQAIDFGVQALHAQVDEVYLLGFSSGGLLCIDYHLRHPETPIQSIFALAPAFKIRFLAAPLTPCLASITPWLHKRKENNYTKYRSIPMKACAEIYKLGLRVRKQMQAQAKLDVKLFMAFVEADQVISSAFSRQFFTRYATEDSRCLIYQSPAPSEHDSRIHYVEGFFPNDPPYVLKHNGLPFSPENTHYGLRADYRKEDRGELLYNPRFSDLAKAVVAFL